MPHDITVSLVDLERFPKKALNLYIEYNSHKYYNFILIHSSTNVNRKTYKNNIKKYLLFCNIYQKKDVKTKIIPSNYSRIRKI